MSKSKGGGRPAASVKVPGADGFEVSAGKCADDEITVTVKFKGVAVHRVVLEGISAKNLAPGLLNLTMMDHRVRLGDVSHINTDDVSEARVGEEMWGTVLLSPLGGRLRKILADDGTQLHLLWSMLLHHGFDADPAPGSRIRFVMERIERGFMPEPILELIPPTPEVEREYRLAAEKENPSSLIGTVDWYDEKRGHGEVCTDDGRTALIIVATIRRAGFRRVESGSRIRCTVRLHKGEWLVSDVLALGDDVRPGKRVRD